jgi:molybdopterin-containing oxidoreductase family membrane subunit
VIARRQGGQQAYGLEAYITPRHFINLGYLLVAFALIMLFFNANEFIVHAFKLRGNISDHLDQPVRGDLAFVYWPYLLGGLIVPPLLILFPATRTMIGVVVAAALVNVGMLLERYFIVVGGLDDPLNPYATPTYSPTWVEWSLMAAGFAGFALMILILLKMVPSVAIWEMREEREGEKSSAPKGDLGSEPSALVQPGAPA